jgi:flagellar motor protein MotB
MIQKELNAENKEIRDKAYELYEKHGFQDGNEFVDWLEAERLMKTGSRPRGKRSNALRNVLIAIVAVLCVAVAVLSSLLLRPAPKMELSQKSLSDLKVMMLVLDQKPDEDVFAFGDTHFDFNKATLTDLAKELLDKEVQVLKDNPKMKVRMAGYTSAAGTEESNQKLSEQRAKAVMDYLIAKGVAQERITTIGYGMTKPAVCEIYPGDKNSKEAKAIMRVLFEIRVK